MRSSDRLRRLRIGGVTTGGVTWPADRALPTFPSPTELAVLDLRGASPAEILLATSLQGVVNRTRPRVWLERNVDEGSYTWLRTLGRPTATIRDVDALVAQFRPDIRGAIVADPAVPATINVATTLAGLEDAVVAEPAVAARLGLTVLVDLRGRFRDDAAAYQWAAEQLWRRTTHRMLVGLSDA